MLTLSDAGLLFLGLLAIVVACYGWLIALDYANRAEDAESR